MPEVGIVLTHMSDLFLAIYMAYCRIPQTTSGSSRYASGYLVAPKCTKATFLKWATQRHPLTTKLSILTVQTSLILMQKKKYALICHMDVISLLSHILIWNSSDSL